MKKSNSVVIVGCGIHSLYAGIKFLDMGYDVSIIEKRLSCLPIEEKIYDNYKLYNDNHRSYIQLLKRFDIPFEKLPNLYQDKELFSTINMVLEKLQPIPHNILITHSFNNMCKKVLSQQELDKIKVYDEIFGDLFETMNALDCINLFKMDITIDTNYYHINTKSINLLFERMLSYFTSRNGVVIYGNEVKHIKYNKKKFHISTDTNSSYTFDIILMTISKSNLISFSFWNQEQKKLLNSVSIINPSIICNIFNNIIYSKVNKKLNNRDEIREYILDKLHIVYPIITNKLSNDIYVWNKGENNILIREKLKNLYNHKFFICSESFSKNNMFINYSLEYVDNIVDGIVVSL